MDQIDDDDDRADRQRRHVDDDHHGGRHDRRGRHVLRGIAEQYVPAERAPDASVLLDHRPRDVEEQDQEADADDQHPGEVHDRRPDGPDGLRDRRQGVEEGPGAAEPADEIGHQHQHHAGDEQYIIEDDHAPVC